MITDYFNFKISLPYTFLSLVVYHHQSTIQNSHSGNQLMESALCQSKTRNKLGLIQPLSRKLETLESGAINRGLDVVGLLSPRVGGLRRKGCL
jgi:hypothetical protein